jgi:uncharacterized protein involved in exopolysaccharide biosynthesis
LFESNRVDGTMNRQRKIEPLGLSGTNPLDHDMSKLREENRLLKDENDRLRREHKDQIAALRREIRHLAQELNALRQASERYPA